MALRRFIFIILAVLLISPISMIAQETRFVVDEDLLKAIQNEVSGERAWDMVSKISRYHRIRGGGEGSDYNRCVEWLAEELKQMGIKDVNIHTYRADGRTKSFLWTSLMGWRVREAELWLVEPTKKLFSRYSDQAVSLMPYSKGGTTEAEVIYAGQGKSDKYYQGLDVKNKIVFAQGGEGGKVHRLAVLQRGAAGVIVGPSNREDRINFVDLIEVNRLYPTREEVANTTFGFSLSRRQERELLSFIHSGEKIKMKSVVDAELFNGNMPVLEAVLTGKEFPSQEIIIMGHLDHYKPGANDNASGSAGMMEMVKSIRNLIDRGDIPPLKRTLRFLWVPEMHGTLPYLAEHQDIRERGIAGMNLDMIGEDYSLCESTFNFTRSPYSVPGYINDLFVSLLSWVEGREFFSPRGTKYRFNPRIRNYVGGSDHVMFNDSFFAVPTPMLGHGDVFHHTNLDTPDKCDPTEMKRISCLALAACLYLANADDSDALNLAREVYNQARVRITERTQHSIRLIHESASQSGIPDAMNELFANVIEYPRIHTEIEAANVRETVELCRNAATKKAINSLVSRLKESAQIEKEEIELAYSFFLEACNIKRGKFQPDNSYTKASSLKPTKLFKGPLPRNILQERLSAGDLNWYETNRDKAGANSDSKMYEILNLMDGQRSVLDIRHIVSCEFGETDVEFVLHFVQDLHKMDLVEF
jgi:aminopeptidase YwaD